MRTVPLVLRVYVLFCHCFFSYAYSCSVFDCLLNSVTVYHDHASCCLLNCFTGSSFLLLILFIHFCYTFSPCFLTSYNNVTVQLVCVLFVDCSLNIKAINSMKVEYGRFITFNTFCPYLNGIVHDLVITI